jgi:SAM-dependent methyltransferase
MTTSLLGLGSVTGVDISAKALNLGQSRGLSALAQASVDRLPFAGASFGLVTSFDVIYERSVKNDLNAVKEFSRLLAPGGFLLLRLPAFDWLRGHHDKVVHTARRYTTGRVAELLREAGLSVRVLSYANTFLFPLALVKRLSDRLRPSHPERSDLTLPLGPFNTIFTAILSWEAPLVARSGLPYGLSVIALAEKPQ